MTVRALVPLLLASACVGGSTPRAPEPAQQDAAPPHDTRVAAADLRASAGGAGGTPAADTRVPDELDARAPEADTRVVDAPAVETAAADTRPADVTRLEAGQGGIDTGASDRPPNAPGILVRVKNGCGVDLWLRAVGKERTLTPDNARLAPGETRDYVAPDTWTAARITAYLAGPDAAGKPQSEIEKVEMTFVGRVLNYNITYVDWMGLPVHMVAHGTGKDCKPVTCPIKQSEIATRCPDGLLDGMRCMSAGHHCARSANRAKPYCMALDAKIAQCAGNPTKYPGCAGAANATTPQVYGCSGFFAGSPKWCAALNRGMLDDPDNGDITLYYKSEPYNTYSKWVHTVCPGIYAFPYDDYGKTNESGFHSCAGGTQLDVVFCPSG